MSLDKRRYYRQPMRTPVRLQVAGAPDALPATLVNISGGGCLVDAAGSLSARLPVRFNLPRPGLADLALTGTLTKVRRAKHDPVYHYGIAFEITESEREELVRFINEEQVRALHGTRADPGPPSLPKRLLEQRSSSRTVASFPIRYTLPDRPDVAYEALALDVSTGGMRIVTDRILRREWCINITLSLPGEGLGAEAPIALLATPLPGIRNSRGRYVHSLSFRSPSAVAVDEILRFIQANELSRTSRSSP